MSLPSCSSSTNDTYSGNEYDQNSESDVDSAANSLKDEDHAYEAAKDCLSLLPYSRQGLIDQLVYEEDFPEDVADAGVSKLERNGEVDWVEQAIRRTQAYHDYTEDLSEEEVFYELTGDYEKYTEEEARAAIEAVYR